MIFDIENSFSYMTKKELNVLNKEFLMLDLQTIPQYGSRSWYLAKVNLWIANEMLDGKKPLG